jgi:hypothetical protein
MSKNNIALLLAKYWEGNTSLAEEQVIKQYFAKAKEDDDTDGEAEYFRQLSHFRQIAIEPIAEPVDVLHKHRWSPKRKLVGMQKYMGIAALIAIVMLVSKLSYDQVERRNQDAAEIARAAEKDLMEISNSLNEGYSDQNISIIANK